MSKVSNEIYILHAACTLGTSFVAIIITIFKFDCLASIIDMLKLFKVTNFVWVEVLDVSNSIYIRKTLQIKA